MLLETVEIKLLGEDEIKEGQVTKVLSSGHNDLKILFEKKPYNFQYDKRSDHRSAKENKWVQGYLIKNGKPKRIVLDCYIRFKKNDK